MAHSAFPRTQVAPQSGDGITESKLLLSFRSSAEKKKALFTISYAGRRRIPEWCNDDDGRASECDKNHFPLLACTSRDYTLLSAATSLLRSQLDVDHDDLGRNRAEPVLLGGSRFGGGTGVTSRCLNSGCGKPLYGNLVPLRCTTAPIEGREAQASIERDIQQKRRRIILFFLHLSRYMASSIWPPPSDRPDLDSSSSIKMSFSSPPG